MILEHSPSSATEVSSGWTLPRHSVLPRPLSKLQAGESGGEREQGRGALYSLDASNAFSKPGSRPAALGCTARALLEKLAGTASHRDDLLTYTLKSVSAPTQPQLVAKETHASGQAISGMRCQSGKSNTVVTAAQMSHSTPPASCVAASTLRGCKQGASEGRRAHSFAFSPPATQHEQEHAGILSPEIPNGAATMSCPSTKRGSARKMSLFTLGGWTGQARSSLGPS